MSEQDNQQHDALQPNSANNPTARTASNAHPTELGEKPLDKQLQLLDGKRRQYGRTQLSNHASAVLGDVVHNNYYCGGNVPYLADLPGMSIPSTEVSGRY